MATYTAPIETIRFLLKDVLPTQEVNQLPGMEDVSDDLLDAILEEGAKICQDALFPLNGSGDVEGCKFDNGTVTTPKGFKELYDMYCQSGWSGLPHPKEYGGQGLPFYINTIMQELVCSANLSFGMYPGLTSGAVNAILQHGSEELKQKYLPKMISGEWTGTMNLTEPQCGTDLGLIKSKAVPNDDGSYDITGTKIFISGGEHDMTDNIIHLVLARLPDAPEGVKGISLFVVPKVLINDDETLGDRNAVTCGSIEEKMGIHAASTCVMNYDNAKGWLVGEANKGLRAMFTMMNEARLAVGMQGMGLAEVAYQQAVYYAKDRLQGRALTGTKYPDKAADPIIVHPDIRRQLLEMKAFLEPARALAVYTGMMLDIEHRSDDPKTKQQAGDWVALMTPIIKAFFTDQGFVTANHAVQVFGGAGYITDHGVEQYVRDARITQIYEGANGIQALDLVGRKMSKDMGKLLRRFFHPVRSYLEARQEDEHLKNYVGLTAKVYGKLQQASLIIAQKGLKNPDEAGAASMDYLYMFSYVALAYFWLQIMEAAQKKLDAGEGDKDMWLGKIHAGKYYFERVLPRANSHFLAMMGGAKTLMDMPDGGF